MATTSISTAGYDPDAGKMKFMTLETTWHDAARDRDVPVKIYYPSDAQEVAARGKSPIIIFSHGLGGSCQGYGYLGEYWASHGYVSVHLTHHGSDTDAVRAAGGFANIKQSGQAIAKDPMNAVNRVKDVGFAIDQITLANDDEKSPLHDRLDLEKIGMAGHSFGAATTLMIAGQTTRTGKTFADTRVKCAIALCPPVVAAKADYDRTYASIKMPIFVITGTRDDSPIGDTMAADRRVPFDHVQNIPAYLITFDGADHMVFSGRRKQAADDQTHKLTLQGTIGFWDAYLHGNEAAKKWIADGGYAADVGASGKFEVRNSKPSNE